MDKSLEKINLVKNKLNKTLTDIAVELGYSYPVIARLLGGKDKITKRFTNNFIAKYDVNPAWFFADASPNASDASPNASDAPPKDASDASPEASDASPNASDAPPKDASDASPEASDASPNASDASPQEPLPIFLTPPKSAEAKPSEGESPSPTDHAFEQSASFASLPKETRALIKVFDQLPMKYKKRIFEFVRGEREEYRELLRKEAEERQQLKEMFENRIPIEETIPVPVVGEVSAGIPSYSEENIIEYLDYDASMVKNPRNFFFLKIRGDSMIECRIFHGDYILIQKETHYRSGDIVVARIEDDLTVKKVRFLRESEKIELIPCNPNYETLTYDAREVTVVGVVVAIDWRSKR